MASASPPSTPLRRSTRLRSLSSASEASVSPPRRTRRRGKAQSARKSGLRAVPEEEEDEDEQQVEDKGKAVAKARTVPRKQQQHRRRTGKKRGRNSSIGSVESSQEEEGSKVTGKEDVEEEEGGGDLWDGASDSDDSAEVLASQDPEVAHWVKLTAGALNAHSSAHAQQSSAAAVASASAASSQQAEIAAAAAVAHTSFQPAQAQLPHLHDAAQFLASKVEKAASAAAAADTQLPDAVGPSIEKLEVAPASEQVKQRRRRDPGQAPSAGPKWFNMQATPMTEAVKRDLQLIKMRGYLDPKRFYKAADSKALPKVFQVGTVQEGAGEYHSARLTKRQRRATIADTLMSDRSFRKYARKNYDEVTAKAKSGGRESHRRRSNKRRPSYARR